MEGSHLYNRLKIVYNTSMFNPKYTISNELLENIKKINGLVIGLNNRRFPKVVLLEMRRTARAVSSYASTRIEGNPLPLTEVKKILQSAPTNIKDSEQEVLNYNQALIKLDQKIKTEKASLSLDLLLKIHHQVTKKLLPDYQSGHLRKDHVIVKNSITEKVLYMPPEINEVAPLVKDLIDFIHQNRHKIDPLVLAGLFHKQLVIIHPFMDGNGRTTRLATKLLLAQMGLNTFDLFSFENYYNENVSRYFEMVGVFGNYYEIVDKIDFTAWLEYFTAGIIDELLRVQKILTSLTVTPQTSLTPHEEKMLAFIRKNGFIAEKDYIKLTDRAKATRVLDFNKMIKRGLIIRHGRGPATYYKIV